MAHTKKYSVTSRTLGWKVILEAAQLARDAGENEKASEMYERVLRVVERRFEPMDLRVGFVLKEVAEFYSAVGKCDKAEPYQKRANSIFESHAAAAPSMDALADEGGSYK